MVALANYGVKIENLNFDPMLAAYLLGEKNLGLKAIVFNKLGVEISSLSDLIGTGKKQTSLAMLEVKQVADYACANADIMWSLRGSL